MPVSPADVTTLNTCAGCLPPWFSSCQYHPISFGGSFVQRRGRCIVFQDSMASDMLALTLPRQKQFQHITCSGSMSTSRRTPHAGHGFSFSDDMLSLIELRIDREKRLGKTFRRFTPDIFGCHAFATIFCPHFTTFGRSNSLYPAHKQGQRRCKIAPEACPLGVRIAIIARLKVHARSAQIAHDFAHGIFQCPPYRTTCPCQTDTGIHNAQRLAHVVITPFPSGPGRGKTGAGRGGENAMYIVHALQQSHVAPVSLQVYPDYFVSCICIRLAP